MITVALLLPVLAVLTWLYWLALPRHGGKRLGWQRFDSLLWMVLVVAAGAFVNWARGVGDAAGGPAWPYLLSAVGAYAILAIGLAGGLAWRHRCARKSTRNVKGR